MFDQDEQEISQIIETGLRAIQEEKLTLEEVLAQHPGQAETIRPELEAALWLTARQEEVGSRPGYVTASRKRVIARIQAEARSRGAKRALFGFAWPRRITFQWAMAAVIFLVVLAGAGGMITVAQATLPGDQLYSVKRISEQMAYTVTLSDVQRVELGTQLADRRMQETTTLVAKGNYPAAEVSISDFERQVNQTVVLLERINQTKASGTLTAALTVKTNLDQQVTQLASLSASAPANLHNKLAEAMNVVNMGVSATSGVIKDNPDLTATITPTELTQTPTMLAPTLLNTQVPDETEIPASVPATQIPGNTPPAVGKATVQPTGTPEPPAAPNKPVHPTQKPKIKTPPGKPPANPTQAHKTPGKNK